MWSIRDSVSRGHSNVPVPCPSVRALGKMQRVAPLKSSSLSLCGEVRTGLGHGAGFTALDWAREQFIALCGIDPHPGTLNVVVDEPAHRRTWNEIRNRPGALVRPPSRDACDAMLYPVAIGGSVFEHHDAGLAAAVVVPDVPDYPGDQLEIIAAVDLRAQFDLADGHRIDVQLQQPHPVDAVIFDVDGTLLNSLDGYRLAASRATEPYGYEVTLEHVQRALNRNQPFWDFVIPDGEPRDEDRIRTLRDATMRHWPDALAEVVGVLPAAAAALESLHSAGLKLGIFTGSGGESFPPLRAAGLLDLFDAVVTGNDVIRRKPDPEGVVECLERLGVEAASAVYVGDSCIDVGASLAAGVMSIAVLTGAGDSASLAAAGAHRVAANVGSVPDLLALGD